MGGRTLRALAVAVLLGSATAVGSIDPQDTRMLS